MHRQRIPSFLYVTNGGRVMLTSRNGTLMGVGRVTESHLPVTAALYIQVRDVRLWRVLIAA